MELQGGEQDELWHPIRDGVQRGGQGAQLQQTDGRALLIRKRPFHSQLSVQRRNNGHDRGNVDPSMPRTYRNKEKILVGPEKVSIISAFLPVYPYKIACTSYEPTCTY